MSRSMDLSDRQIARLLAAVGGHIGHRSTLDLLVFWGHYPNGWFGRRAIRPITLAPRREIEEALGSLVKDGVIECRYDGQEPYYSLTSDPSVREAVKELASLTTNARRYLLHLARGQRMTDGREPERRAQPRSERRESHWQTCR